MIYASSAIAAFLVLMACLLASSGKCTSLTPESKRDMECGGGPRYILDLYYGETYVGTCDGCRYLRKRVAVEPYIPPVPYKPKPLPIPKFGSCRKEGGVCQVYNCEEVIGIVQNCSNPRTLFRWSRSSQNNPCGLPSTD